MTGKMFSDRWGRISCGVIFLSFNWAFFPQFLLGSRGMPRRYYNYQPEFQTLHVNSTLGAFVLGIGFLMLSGVLIHSLLRGRKAPANPWGAATLEWQCSSPPPSHNFSAPPQVGDPYAVDLYEYRSAQEGFVAIETGADIDDSEVVTYPESSGGKS